MAFVAAIFEDWSGCNPRFLAAMRARAGEGGMPGDAPETGTTIMAVIYKG